MTTKINIRKKSEFNVFLRLIKDGQVAHWVDIARVLGVENATISIWKQLPEAQQAIAEGISRAVAEMERVGAKDWRMWHEKYKMLAGREDTQTTQVNFIMAVLNKYGGGKGEGISDVPAVETVTEGSSESST